MVTVNNKVLSARGLGRSQIILGRLSGATAALVVGVGLRLWVFFNNDSFWRDESRLLLNAAGKSFLELRGPLDFNAQAPLPLLWLYRLIFLAGGGGEYSIWAISLLASILTLCLFYALARKLLPDPRAVLFVTWLLALAPGTILFSAMAKPYALDLLVATALLWLAVPVLASQDRTRSPAAFTLASALAPWFSYPAIFVVAGLGTGLLIGKRRLDPTALTKFFAAVLISFSLEIWLVMGPSLKSHGGFPSWCFLQFTPFWLKWAAAQIGFAYLGPQDQAGTLLLSMLGALSLLGVWQLVRQSGWPLIAALLGPLLLALGASACHFYPIPGRLLLFAAPGLILLVGFGVAGLFRLYLYRGLFRVFLPACLVILLIPCVLAFFKVYARPPGGVRSALQFISAHQQAGDLVFCDSLAAATIAYYRLLGYPEACVLESGWPEESQIEGRAAPQDLQAKVILSRIPPGRRVWLVAESLNYAWRVPPIYQPYWQETLQYLARVRGQIGAYATNQVQVQGFSAERADQAKDQ